MVSTDSNAARLLAVRQKEVLVAPRLEAVVVGDAAVRVTGVRERLVKVGRVLGVQVVRREVGPTAEPQRIAFGQATEVRVCGGDER